MAALAIATLQHPAIRVRLDQPPVPELLERAGDEAADQRLQEEGIRDAGAADLERRLPRRNGADEERHEGLHVARAVEAERDPPLARVEPDGPVRGRRDAGPAPQLVPREPRDARRGPGRDTRDGVAQ